MEVSVTVLRPTGQFAGRQMAMGRMEGGWKAMEDGRCVVFSQARAPYDGCAAACGLRTPSILRPPCAGCGRKAAYTPQNGAWMPKFRYGLVHPLIDRYSTSQAVSSPTEIKRDLRHPRQPSRCERAGELLKT